MTDTLDKRTHGWLGDIQDRLRRQPYVEKSLELGACQAFMAWCDQHDLDLEFYQRHQVLRFDRQLMRKVQALLESLGQLPLGESTSGRTTAEQARASHQEDKAQREGPRAHRVLLNMPATTARPGMAHREREILDVDWRELDLSAFDVLLMIENLDSFYEPAVALDALADHARPLVVYRGDRHYGGGFRELARAWATTGKPLLGLGDFDPRGLRIVLGSGATGLLLPPLAWLQENATRAHVPAEQLPDQPALRKHRDQLPAAHPLGDYLALLLDEQRGLKQQWFTSQLVVVGARGQK
ncbi:DUF7281 domain-containing protein [Halomonas halmophila]|uniref:DUF7281 domain-containing protein n=1 Tax=Halomonas halmophila TaxID=252 RepID=A0A4Y4F8Q3_9GAMM|nr:hypothetical protein [Halomonas halmophila]GED23531.1 hypothetical protein HHA01_25080 [Halomonas halmophila]